MCRNIKNLFNFEPGATPEEIEDAARQYVRKISGFTEPSLVNKPAFEKAVAEIANASSRLLASLSTDAPKKDREIEAAKAKARNEKRFGA